MPKRTTVVQIAPLRRRLQLVAVLLLTALLIWLFLRNASLPDVGKILRRTNFAWVALAVALNLIALVFRTIRWRIVLNPDDPPSFYATFFANSVGYMLSSILPIRAADFARPALLARKTSHRFSGALGTVLTERILDLVSMLLLFLFFAIRRWPEYTARPDTASLWRMLVQPAAIAAALALTAMTLFIIGLLLFTPFVRRLHQGLGRLVPRRFRDSWMNFFDAFVRSLDIARHRRFWIVLVCTAGIWACLTAQFTFSARALHIPLPLDSNIFVTGAATLSLVIPTPGGIGAVHKTSEFIMRRFYGLDVDSAVAAALLFHLIGFAPVLVIGGTLALREGLRWRDVTRGE